MGVTGVEGTFRQCCEVTMEAPAPGGPSLAFIAVVTRFAMCGPEFTRTVDSTSHGIAWHVNLYSVNAAYEMPPLAASQRFRVIFMPRDPFRDGLTALT